MYASNNDYYSNPTNDLYDLQTYENVPVRYGMPPQSYYPPPHHKYPNVYGGKMPTNPQMNQMGHPFPPGYQPYHYPMWPPNQPGTNTQGLFKNPLQPATNKNIPASGQMYQPYVPMHPYPLPPMPKQTSGLHSFLNSFKGQDGNIDFNKMADTAGNMFNAFSQVSSVVKNFSSMFKA